MNDQQNIPRELELEAMVLVASLTTASTPRVEVDKLFAALLEMLRIEAEHG